MIMNLSKQIFTVSIPEASPGFKFWIDPERVDV
jgi:hypothetical protein